MGGVVSRGGRVWLWCGVVVCWCSACSVGSVLRCDICKETNAFQDKKKKVATKKDLVFI